MNNLRDDFRVGVMSGKLGGMAMEERIYIGMSKFISRYFDANDITTHKKGTLEIHS